MSWTKVDRAGFDAYQYEEDIKILWVKFASGRVYSYRDVDRECLDDWLDGKVDLRACVMKSVEQTIFRPTP